MRTAVDNIVARLEDAREVGAGWLASCPAHDDHRPSLKVDPNRAGDGAVLCCRAGCENADVFAAMNLPLAAGYDRYWQAQDAPPPMPVKRSHPPKPAPLKDP